MHGDNENTDRTPRGEPDQLPVDGNNGEDENNEDPNKNNDEENNNEDPKNEDGNTEDNNEENNGEDKNKNNGKKKGDREKDNERRRKEREEKEKTKREREEKERQEKKRQERDRQEKETKERKSLFRDQEQKRAELTKILESNKELNFISSIGKSAAEERPISDHPEIVKLTLKDVVIGKEKKDNTLVCQLTKDDRTLLDEKTIVNCQWLPWAENCATYTFVEDYSFFATSFLSGCDVMICSTENNKQLMVVHINGNQLATKPLDNAKNKENLLKIILENNSDYHLLAHVVCDTFSQAKDPDTGEPLFVVDKSGDLVFDKNGDKIPLLVPGSTPELREYWKSLGENIHFYDERGGFFYGYLDPDSNRFKWEFSFKPNHGNESSPQHIDSAYGEKDKSRCILQ